MASLVCLILIMLWTTEGSSLSLTSSPAIIGRNGTRNLTLTCFIHELNETHSDVSAIDVVKMRILKLGNNEWKPVIEMERSWKSPNVFGGQEGSASKSESGINHLQVTWALATDKDAAHYMCDIIGYTHNQEAIGQRSPSVFVDVVAPLTMYQLFSMFQTSNKKFEKALTKISTNEENLDKSQKSLDKALTKISTNEENLNKSQKSIDNALTKISTNDENLDQSQKTLDVLSGIYFSMWPQGVYGLLQPESGCPADVGVIWKHGYRTHNTESQARNKDSASSPAHMKKPIMWTDGSSKLMRQYFCSVDKQSTGRLWPAGSYCVNRYKSETCPLGFKGNGNIQWDDEDTRNKNDVSGTHPVNYFGPHSTTRIYYCCRNDRSPHTPIHLPRRKPFYLYRFGGTCQEVVNMKVTPEYMFFDTEGGGGYYNAAPDGKDSYPDVKLHLCYYETT